MIGWIVWGFLLIGQQVGQTWTSRARNSKNLRYHALGAVFSNGVWFCSQFFIVKWLTDVQTHQLRFAAIAVFYIVLTVAGSVGMHVFLLKWEERKHVER